MAPTSSAPRPDRTACTCESVRGDGTRGGERGGVRRNVTCPIHGDGVLREGFVQQLTRLAPFCVGLSDRALWLVCDKAADYAHAVADGEISEKLAIRALAQFVGEFGETRGRQH